METIKIRFSQVEQSFYSESGKRTPTTPIPYIVVNNFPKLGLITAMRFLEWVAENPHGVISLPTGKTPEYFIKWVRHFLGNWSGKLQESIRGKYGFRMRHKPDLRGLNFVQIDEFYPINPSQHNSFNFYVQEYYIRGFGLDPAKTQFINCEEIPRPNGLSLSEIFPNNKVDLSLRYRECKSNLEEIQQKAIFMVDQWCTEYENKIREKKGIGFFLGGLGPDGHIAFNVRGSDHNSTTRLTETNFKTQAAAATELGGIEISRNRLVITIGLSTITYNPEATAIIIVAGEAKAGIVRKSLESKPDIQYPATALQNMKNGRFYLTCGAAGMLSDVVEQTLDEEEWTWKKKEWVVIDLCKRLNKYGTRLTLDDLKHDTVCSNIPDLDKTVVPKVIKSIKRKLDRAVNVEEYQTFLHTGPHHDDIMLGFLPHVVHLIRSPLNRHYFAIMTSGFTSVTNKYIRNILINTRSLLAAGKIQMIRYPDFFDQGYKFKWDKDVYHYLDRIASNNRVGCERGLSHRVVRALVDIYGINNRDELRGKINEILAYFDRCYDGEKNPEDIQLLKGMIREFEEELVWAHYGVQVKDVRHLRLGFYTGDIFTETPERTRDVDPILELIKDINPTVITLALDPEGSGPDTHYKVLQAIAEAVRIWSRKTDLSGLRIWGYRNVWYRFNPAEADIIVPVTLNSMAVLRDTFMSCYLSQKEASFPSHELDGPFCDLTRKIWVEQHQLLELVLGRDFWYENDHPRLRAAHGVIYLKEMNVEQFLLEARRLEKTMEGQIGE